MVFIGIDHSTTGVKTAIMSRDEEFETFTIERSASDDGAWSFLDNLSGHVDLETVELIANSYSYGDNFSEITDIEAVDGRGVVDHMGAGHGFGTGTQVFDELAESDLPCIVYPGVHNGLDCLHPYFQHYSVYCGADMVAMTRFSKDVLSEEYGEDASFIAACVSSSSMATVVIDGTLRGAFHWIGLIHGHVDIDYLRRIKHGEERPDDIFMKSGLLYRSGKSFEQIKGVPDAELLESVYWATVHNIYSLYPFAKVGSDEGVDAVTLSGRLRTVTEPFDLKEQITDATSDVAPTHICPDFASAKGAALIAKEVANGADDVLGIPVGKSPVGVITR